MNPTRIAPLAVRLRSARAAGEVYVATRSEDAAAPVGLPEKLDAFTATLGLQPLAHAWREIEEITARAILRRILTKDLPHGRRLMTTRTAAGFVDELWAALPLARRHFTNATFTGRAMQLAGWNPISTAKYDTGVASSGGAVLTLLWTADND